MPMQISLALDTRDTSDTLPPRQLPRPHSHFVRGLVREKRTLRFRSFEVVIYTRLRRLPLSAAYQARSNPNLVLWGSALKALISRLRRCLSSKKKKIHKRIEFYTHICIYINSHAHAHVHVGVGIGLRRVCNHSLTHVLG